MKLVKDFYRNRFKDSELSYETRNLISLRNKIWIILCKHFFQKMITEQDTVMDIGAGYCEFINNVNCKIKIAVDLNPDTKLKAGEKVNVLQVNALSIPKSFNGKIDVIFISNFLEHLSSKEEVIAILEKSYQLLERGGKIIIMQPNIDLVKERYWDFIDHIVPLNLKSLSEALETSGFDIKTRVKRFLPYTTKSKLSIFSEYFLKIYLFLPPIIRPFAGQSLIVARKN